MRFVIVVIIEDLFEQRLKIEDCSVSANVDWRARCIIACLVPFRFERAKSKYDPAPGCRSHHPPCFSSCSIFRSRLAPVIHFTHISFRCGMRNRETQTVGGWTAERKIERSRESERAGVPSSFHGVTREICPFAGFHESTGFVFPLVSYFPGLLLSGCNFPGFPVSQVVISRVSIFSSLNFLKFPFPQVVISRVFIF